MGLPQQLLVWLCVVLFGCNLLDVDGVPWDGKTTEQMCSQAAQYPGTPNKVLKDSSPFTIIPNQTSYFPGQTLKVTVSGTITFMGFILQAKNAGNVESVGHFKDHLPEAKVNVNSCKDHKNNTIAVWYNAPRASATLEWTSPSSNAGALHFMGTVFHNKSSFLTDVKSTDFSKGFEAIDLSTCGKSKGCFRYAAENVDSCTQNTCDYLVTFQTTAKEAVFELSAKAGWVAIGFSSDDKMGGDDVLLCKRNQTGVEVGQYFNDVAYSKPRKANPNTLESPQYKDENGRISCRFRRPLTLHDRNSVDLSNDWFQLYAWGPIYSTSGEMMRHTLEKPPTSTNKITLSNRHNLTGKATKLTSSVILMSVSLLIALNYFSRNCGWFSL